jgi:hypothetical protein
MADLHRILGAESPAPGGEGDDGEPTETELERLSG